jgi:hypothetical protein
MSTETEGKVSSMVDWDSVDLPRNKSKINYLRLKSGNNYVVRLFHKPVPVLRYYNNGKSAICGNPDTCPIAIKYPNIKLKSRYAILVLDRGDKSTVKVLEAPAGVFKDFRKLYDAEGIDPGGNAGPDFFIKVTGEGINTRYEVTPKRDAKPFSKEEQDAITFATSNGYDLDELFKPTDPAKIEAILMSGTAPADDESDQQPSPPSGPARTQSKTPASVAAAPAKAASKSEFDWAGA